MWNGKNKALTISMDDGVLQDKRFIKLLNRYGLKATFNINSELLGNSNTVWFQERISVAHCKFRPEEVRSVYEGHEIAGHTLKHPRLTKLEDDEVIRQVEEDRLRLSELAGYEVVGFAYPCGGVNYDSRVSELIRSHTGAKYARTIASNQSFDLQDNLFEFKPTCHMIRFDDAFARAEEFLDLTPETPKLFYIWGHSYEFDIEDTWDKVEELFRLISARNDIFYGTNKEILL